VLRFSSSTNFESIEPDDCSHYVYIYIEIRFSCAYWLLSVICLLDSQLSKCCVSHRQQISSLSNRIIALITCHQENSSITTLRASFPTMSLFFLTFPLLLVDSCSTASQAMLGAKVLVLVCGVIAWCGPNLLYLNSNLCYFRPFLEVLQDPLLAPL
jgi:hypothetical protein